MFKPTPLKPVLYKFVFCAIKALKGLLSASRHKVGLLCAVQRVNFKRNILLAGIFLLAFTTLLPLLPDKIASAATPTLNFQARLENGSGAIAPDGWYNVEFKLYEGGTTAGGGTLEWTETYYDSNGVTAGNDNRVRVANGYLTVNLGSLTNFPGTINWDEDLFLSMNIGGTTQTATPVWDGEMTPLLKLTSVPYAFQAQSATQLEVAQGGNTGTLAFDTLTTNRNILLPDEDGTVCLQGASSCGFAASSGSANYIQNGTSLQTSANFNIQAADNAANGTIAGIFRGAAGGQTVDLVQFQASNGTTLGAITAGGNLQVATSVDTYTATNLNIGSSNATAITIAQAGVSTTIAGDLTVGEAATFGDTVAVTGLTTLSGGLTITSGGNVAIQRNTTNYTATGQQNNVNFGTGALFRITSASDVTITGIDGGVDGRIITLFNASSNTVTIANNDTVNSDADNVVITGTGSSITIPAGSSVQLVYDSASSVWRVVGAASTTGGYIQNQNSTDQTANFRISGTGQANTGFLAPSLDVVTAGTLSLGATTATAIDIGKAGMTTTVQGALTVDELLTGGAGATVSGGAISLSGNAASSFTTSSGALTLTSATAATWSTTAGDLTLQAGSGTVSFGTSTLLTAAGTLSLTSGGANALTVDAGGAAGVNIGTTNANAVTISRSGVTTTVQGALTVSQAATFNGTAQFNENVTVASGKTLRLTGGTTNSVSPTAEGQLYYDTDTNQLLVAFQNPDTSSYQWKAAGQDAVLVAASNSSNADKQAADYVADGTADQVEINYALSQANPAGSGRKTGRVYLFAGTYTIADTISIPNNTTLAGSGKATLVQFGNLAGVSKDMITNTTTAGAGTGVTIRDLTLDGNKTTNSTGTVRGIYLNGTGSSSATPNLPGATVTDVAVQNFNNNGIHIADGANNVITNNVVQANGNYNIYINNSNHDIVTANTVTNATLIGIYLTATNRDLVTNNFVGSNASHGIRIDTGSNNTISDNILRSNTGSGSASSIYLSNTDTNLITNNNITDTAGSGYAINVSDTGSDANYLSNNIFSGTGATSINDLSDATGGYTVYANQIKDASNGNIYLQPAGSINLDSGTIATNATTLNLFNTTATTVNAFGAATTLALGGSGGTATFGNGGAFTLQGSNNQNLTVRSQGTGALTLTSAVAATWSTTAGDLTLQAGSGEVSLGTSTVLKATGALTVTSGGANALSLDTGGGAAINIGATNATSIVIGRAAGGTIRVGQNGGTVQIDGTNFDVSTTGVVTLTGGVAGGDILTQGTNALGIDTGGAAGISLGVTNANAVTIGRSGVTTEIQGNTKVTLNATTGTGLVCQNSGTGVLSVCDSTYLAPTAGNFIQNQNGSDQTANFRISGTGRANTSILTPLIDVASAGTLQVGTGTATAITIGKSGITTTNAGALTVTQLLTGNAGATVSGGAISLTGNAASSFTTSSGALTLTSAVAATWSTTAGNLTLQAGSGTVSLGASTSLTANGALGISSGGANSLSLDAGGAAAVNIGTTNANAVSISRTGVTTTVNGALTVTQLLTGNAGATISGGAISLSGNAASSFTTSSGALTLTSAAAATWSTTTGNLNVQAGGTSALNLNTGGAGAVNVGATNTATVQIGGTAATTNVVLQAGSSAGNGIAVQSSSTTAFRVQNSGASSTLLTADASANRRVTVGTVGSIYGTSGSNGDLVVVGNTEIQGVLYFGNSGSNAIYTSSAGGPLRFKGTARNSVAVTLVPEFAGAVMTGDGSSNVGVMTSDFCSGSSYLNIPSSSNPCGATEEHNYYSWTTSQGSAQDYDVYVRWLVPSDYDSSDSMPAINFYGWRTNTTNDSITMTVRNGSTTCGTATSVGGSNGAWSQATYTTGSCGTITPGSTVLTFRIRMTAGSGDFTRLGEIGITYNSVF